MRASACEHSACALAPNWRARLSPRPTLHLTLRLTLRRFQDAMRKIRAVGNWRLQHRRESDAWRRRRSLALAMTPLELEYTGTPAKSPRGSCPRGSPAKGRPAARTSSSGGGGGGSPVRGGGAARFGGASPRAKIAAAVGAASTTSGAAVSRTGSGAVVAPAAGGQDRIGPHALRDDLPEWWHPSHRVTVLGYAKFGPAPELLEAVKTAADHFEKSHQKRGKRAESISITVLTPRDASASRASALPPPPPSRPTTASGAVSSSHPSTSLQPPLTSRASTLTSRASRLPPATAQQHQAAGVQAGDEAEASGAAESQVPFRHTKAARLAADAAASRARALAALAAPSASERKAKARPPMEAIGEWSSPRAEKARRDALREVFINRYVTPKELER